MAACAKTREVPNDRRGAPASGAGLRPTRQRIELAGLLFRDGDRHVTAESLHAEAVGAGIKVSLATVYNTLHQFTAGGPAAPGGGGCGAQLFRHQHRRSSAFLPAKTKASLIDIPGRRHRGRGRCRRRPPGMAVDRVDVVVRVQAALTLRAATQSHLELF